jgi:hypothetical protein
MRDHDFANDAGNDFGGGSAFSFKMQGRRCGGSAKDLIGLIPGHEEACPSDHRALSIFASSAYFVGELFHHGSQT